MEVEVFGFARLLRGMDDNADEYYVSLLEMKSGFRVETSAFSCGLHRWFIKRIFLLPQKIKKSASASTTLQQTAASNPLSLKQHCSILNNPQRLPFARAPAVAFQGGRTERETQREIETKT